MVLFVAAKFILANLASYDHRRLWVSDWFLLVAIQKGFGVKYHYGMVSDSISIWNSWCHITHITAIQVEKAFGAKDLDGTVNGIWLLSVTQMQKITMEHLAGKQELKYFLQDVAVWIRNRTWGIAR